MIVIEASELTKTYQSGEVQVPALRGVDLAVPEGQFVAIMGPSGSGKSTLLHLLGGIDVPTSGRVMLEGKDLAQLDDTERTIMRRERIGFVFQSFNLLPTMTAEENVSLPLLLDGVPAAEAHKRSLAILERLGMQHRHNHIPATLSGGEQQRIAIARSLVIEPALLLADEPTGNLDSANGEQITELLRQLVDEGGHTIVMVTHDADVAAQADRLVHVRDGKIESEEEFRRNPVEQQQPALKE